MNTTPLRYGTAIVAPVFITHLYAFGFTDRCMYDYDAALHAMVFCFLAGLVSLIVLRWRGLAHWQGPAFLATLLATAFLLLMLAAPRLMREALCTGDDDFNYGI